MATINVTKTEVSQDTTPQLGGQLDVNSQAIGDGTRELLTFTEDASAVNHVNIENEATGSGPIISAAGDDPAVDLNIVAKGTGNVKIGVFTFDGDQSVGVGQDNYVLTYDNAGGLISLEAAAAAGLNNVVEDTTPQLGGALDGQGNDLNNMGVLFLTEQAAAEADVAGKGQFWVETATPNVAKFTDDAGTDFSLAVEGSTAVGIGQHTIWVPAAAMEPRVTTAPATSNAVEIATSLIALRTMDFATDADDHAGFAIQMPKNWNESTLVAQFVWSTTGAQTAGLDGVAWFIRAGAYASNDVLTTALGTAVGATAQDHSATANDIMITSETAAITVAGSPGAEEWVYFEVYRDVSDGGDDLDIDARLHGVKIHYTTNAGTDD